MRLELSVLIALVAILGGVGTVVGPLLGALVLIPLSEVTRSQLAGSGNTLDLVLYGGLIMLIAAFQPNGLVALGDRFRRRREAVPPAGDETERGEAPLVGAPGTRN
jgi:branched-chain amino acid transport system permease protein